MNWSEFFIPTLKESPSDAEVKSHALMVRAGLIRKVSAGVYTYLPLGLRTLRKAIEIVRREMNDAGAIELMMPVLSPISLWQETGRDVAYGPVMYRVKDRDGREMVMGPTHEEVITDTVRGLVGSHKQLPVNLYQIQSKFRDELRPSGGVLRTKEFLMKDAYSFDATPEGTRASFDAMYVTYCRIFHRAGLNFVVAQAEAGAIGGDVNYEFMVPTDVGEDYLVRCTQCGYAANTEAAGIRLRDDRELPAVPQDAPAAETVDTPKAHTVEQVATFLDVKPTEIAKTMVYVTDDGKPVFAMVRGDHELNESKLRRAVGREVRMAEPAEIQTFTGGPLGFTGPVGLNGPVYIDQALLDMPCMVTGANARDKHTTGVCLGRDFAPAEVADLRVAGQGDACPKCGLTMDTCRSVEVGHVFNLGTHYSKPMNATVQNDQGENVLLSMGCYGIGINRILACAVETNCDDDGIIWPISLAPFEVEVLPLSADDDVTTEARRIADQLEAAGAEVLFDDRDARPGFKFKDADLVGCPIRVAVGGKSLAKGVAELKLRHEADRCDVPLAEIVDKVLSIRTELFDLLKPTNYIAPE